MTSTSRPAAREVRCPGCGGISLYAADNPYRPFCSERCRRNDLGAWASERYRVETRPGSRDDEGSDLPDRA
ncbi:MAG: DNA gyrase inhibitor YacG [Proteobacteria bacterium]|nr:DNA gyrase inhibitor YacG [Pseudomonadota bacterium]